MSKHTLSAKSPSLHGLLALCLSLGIGCGYEDSGKGDSSSSASAGSSGSGGSSGGGGSSVTSSAGSGGRGGASSASESRGGAGSSGGKAGDSASGGKSAVGGSSSAVDTSTSGGGKGGKGGAGGGGAVGGSQATGGTSKTGGTASLGGAGGTAGTTAKTGGSATGGTAAGGSGGSTSTGTPGEAKPSDGCGKTPSTLKSATVGQATPVNNVSVGGASRQFLVRWPSNYDNSKPYRLHIGLHGANGDLAENGRDNFGLWSLSKDSTIFVTLAGVNKLWDGPRDLLYADEVIKQVESELCIDKSRVFLEGFSMGAAMSWFLTCSRPGVFRGVVGHSGGGVQVPSSLTCAPVAYLGSLGTGESGNGQNTQTDRFAKANSCTIETLPKATTGKHVCTPYKDCKDGFPVTWCSFDGGHGFTPRDSGASTTWMPQAAWDFISPL